MGVFRLKGLEECSKVESANWKGGSMVNGEFPPRNNIAVMERDVHVLIRSDMVRLLDKFSCLATRPTTRHPD